jgi:16S rRNA (uracil1498-N3)-methyltransferase
MRRRFFVERFTGQTAIIEGETAHHLGRVLRAQQGQLYELSDGSKVWLGRIQAVARDRIDFALMEELPARHCALDVTLLLSIVKFDAFEWAIEKATELGVAAIVPLVAARSEKALLGAAKKRAERWGKILTEASQQSRRLRVPQLAPLTASEQGFAAHPDATKILLSEQSDAPPLRTVLPGAKPAQAILAIGPEGGWTESEFGAAKAAGFREASLGHLILRTETAVVAALASLNYAFGEYAAVQPRPI